MRDSAYICMVHQQSSPVQTEKIRLMNKAIVLYVIYSVFHASCFMDTMPIVKGFIEMIFVISLFMFVFIWIRFGRKNLWIGIFAIFMFLMPIYFYKLGTYRTFDIYMILAMSVGYPFEKLLKTYLKWGTASLLFVVLCSMIGILPDIISKRDDLMLVETAFTSHAVGFMYRSSPAYISMCLLICYLYIHRNSCTIRHILLYTLLSFFVYWICVTRLQLLVNILMLIICFFVYKVHLFKFNHSLWKWVAIMGFPFFLFLIYILFSSAEYRFIQEDETLNQIFNARFFLNQGAFERYDVNTWGNMIETSTGEGREAYFYIDSGYVATLLRYGWLFSFIIMLMYSWTFYKIYKTQNYFLYGWMLIFMFICMVNNFVISVVQFPLLLLAFTKLPSEKFVP